MLIALVILKITLQPFQRLLLSGSQLIHSNHSSFREAMMILGDDVEVGSEVTNLAAGSRHCR
jgi:hypothetical protein